MQRTHRYAGRQAAQPSSTYLSIYSGGYNTYNNERFNIYCCSNYSSYSGYIGSFMDPYGSSRTSNFYSLYITRYDRSSSYAGCIRLYGSEAYYNNLYYVSGVYTCNIQDSNGRNQRINFALYSYNSEFYFLLDLYYRSASSLLSSARNVPSVYHFQHIQSSSSVLSLACQTRTAPPTEITLQRNGVNLTVDGSVIQMTQTVTSRQSSYFTSTITINDDPDNVIGNYTVVTGNIFGQSMSGTISIRGILWSLNTKNLNSMTYFSFCRYNNDFQCYNWYNW